MKIVADENIPLAQEFFGTLGELELVPGRNLSAAEISNADVLIVRSVTPVNSSLLEDSSIKFVGSCTIGTDHLDVEFLNRNRIAWANAPGCNANSVVEYVFAALAALSVDWREKRFAVIGCGNVGSRLYNQLRALELRCDVVDPALTTRQCPDLVDLTQALQADVICLHTPLTLTGPWSTHHMINGERLEQMPNNAILINAGRGGVVDNSQLLAHLDQNPNFKAVLDVWEHEPAINLQLLDKAALATPHIAGYSYDGKVKGTEMIYQWLCQSLGVEASATLGQVMPETEQAVLKWSGQRSPEDINKYLRQAYDIQADDKNLRAVMASSDQPGVEFDLLRKNYPVRREFTNFQIPPSLSGNLKKTLLTLGFQKALHGNTIND